MLNIKQNHNTLTTISLPKYKMWSIGGDRRGDVISCLSGSLWVTQDGDLIDHVVEAGRQFWVTRPGTVVVQALDDASFKMSPNEHQVPVDYYKASAKQANSRHIPYNAMSRFNR